MKKSLIRVIMSEKVPRPTAHPHFSLFIPGDNYKSMSLETISLMIDWSIYFNLPTRLKLLIPWQISQWNDSSNYCNKCSVFAQKCDIGYSISSRTSRSRND